MRRFFRGQSSNHEGPTTQACPERSRRDCLAGRPPAGPAALRYFFLLLTILLAPILSASDCLPIHEAAHHVGETKCVIGKVIRVKDGTKGVHYLDFCEDQLACPFTVGVFPSDLKDVGDIRRLTGRTIEIHGAVKLYDSRAEII